MEGILMEKRAPHMERLADLGVDKDHLISSCGLFPHKPFTSMPIFRINNSYSSTSNNYNNNNNNRSTTVSSQTCDETDNKTSEQHLLFSKAMYSMNDIFHREDERLKTFQNWPLQDWLDKHELARTGMFYTGDVDKVKCYFCEVEIGRWEEQDRPVPEHLRWSPNCPLLRRRTTNNVPIDPEALDHILPPVSYDLCGAHNDVIEVRPHAYPEGTINMSRNAFSSLTSTSTSTSTPAQIYSPVVSSSCSPASTYYPDYPEYAIEAARLRSFAEWPRLMKQRPEQLSEAGFFYTGSGDRVKCFSCGGGLKDWDEHDDPWEQHALWLRKCRYLNLIKGPAYVESVLAKQKAQEAAEVKPSETIAPNNNAQQPMECSNATITTTNTTTLHSDDVLAVAKSTDCHRPISTKTTTATAAASSSSSIPEEKLCKICYAGEYNTAFLPCGHVVACAKCASSVTKCPLCRKPFTDVMRVYFS